MRLLKIALTKTNKKGMDGKSSNDSKGNNPQNLKSLTATFGVQNTVLQSLQHKFSAAHRINVTIISKSDGKISKHYSVFVSNHRLKFSAPLTRP